jgi:hypothetical protein
MHKPIAAPIKTAIRSPIIDDNRPPEPAPRRTDGNTRSAEVQGKLRNAISKLAGGMMSCHF